MHKSSYVNGVRCWQPKQSGMGKKILRVLKMREKQKMTIMNGLFEEYWNSSKDG